MPEQTAHTPLFHQVLDWRERHPGDACRVYVSHEVADSLSGGPGAAVFTAAKPWHFGDVLGADWYVDPHLRGNEMRIEADA